MTAQASESGPDSPGGDALRQAIERDHEVLFRRIRILLYKLSGPLRRDEIDDRAKEVLNDTVQRALRVAERFDPRRSALAWLMAFAVRILQEQRRGRARRPVVQSDLGEEAWRGVLEGLCTGDADATAIRLDVRQALARLEGPQQHILKLRYFEGLDGEDFAQAAGAPSLVAARVRLARALQALRAQFGLAEGEGRP